MVERKSWDEFRATGLAWYVNMILHAFGWALTFELEDNKVVNAYPSRVKFRGFSTDINDRGYLSLNQYMANNSKELLVEAEDGM